MIADAFDIAEKRAASFREMSYRAVGSSPVMASAPTGLGGLGAGMEQAMRHGEQYRHFKDWVYTAIRPICNRIAGQQVFVASVPEEAYYTGMQEASTALQSGLMRRKHDRDYSIKASLPQCFKSIGERLEPLEDHPLLRNLMEPNEIHVQWSLFWMSVASLYITGKAFWWIDTDAPDGFSIWPIPSTWCEPIHTKDKLFAAWKVTPPTTAKSITVPGELMAYFPFPDPSDPLSAMSPMQTQAGAVMVDDAILRSQHHGFKNDLKPGMVITAGRLKDAAGQAGPRPVLTPEQRTQLITAVRLAYQGVIHHNEPIIVDGLIENVAPYTRSNAEMDWLASSTSIKARIMQGVGTNPIVTGEIEGANRASAAVADDNFCALVVNPLISLKSQVMTRRLGPLFSRGGERLVIWIEEARSKDEELKLRKYETGLDTKSVTRNEYRVNCLNLPPRDDCEDDLTQPSAEEQAQQAMDLLAARGAPRKPMEGEEEGEIDAEDRRRAEEAEDRKKRGKKKSTAIVTSRPALVLPSPNQSLRSTMGVKGAVELWTKSHGRVESGLTAALQKMFSKQAEGMISDLADVKLSTATPSSLANALMDRGTWTRELKTVVEPYLLWAGERGIASELLTHKSKAAGSKMKVPQDLLDDYHDFLAKVFKQPYWQDVQDTTRDALARKFKEYFDADGSPSVDDLASVIRKVLRGDGGLSRAKNIATTEVTGALNHGHYLGIMRLAEDGVIEETEWSALLHNTRDSHYKLHGTKVKAGKNFNVGGHSVPYPGHYSLPAAERCQCRCVLLSVVNV